MIIYDESEEMTEEKQAAWAFKTALKTAHGLLDVSHHLAARARDLEVENLRLRSRLGDVEEQLKAFVFDAVTGLCLVEHEPGRQRVYSHRFNVDHRPWFDFLIERGDLICIDEDRGLFVFRDEPT